ncbi:MAG: LysM peptidoglycan-binding domain-containing protein, partial [Candidatus Dadabacteria bacterium]
LRSETCRYVPKFYAAVAIARDPEAYGLSWRRDVEPWAYDTVRVATPVDLTTAARAAGVGRRVLEELNPALLRGCTPPGAGAYPLRVPPGRGPSVAEALERLPPEQRLSFERYRVRPGDTLWGIARRFDTRVAAISELNRIRSARSLRPGQELVVPVPRGFKPRRPAADTVAAADGYRVKPGDTLWAIARRFGTSVAELRRWNGLGRSSLLRPGQVLRVRPERVASGAVHVVEPGDTLWGIARRYGVELSDLLDLNGWGPDRVLRPGDEVRVPARASGG